MISGGVCWGNISFAYAGWWYLNSCVSHLVNEFCIDQNENCIYLESTLWRRHKLSRKIGVVWYLTAEKQRNKKHPMRRCGLLTISPIFKPLRQRLLRLRLSVHSPFFLSLKIHFFSMEMVRVTSFGRKKNTGTYYLLISYIKMPLLSPVFMSLVEGVERRNLMACVVGIMSFWSIVMLRKYLNSQIND